ncbi:MAG: hypothetical protein LPJ91_09540 [Pseudazoarcus pumilus]|nr:hypothetical protein [Pseudazoarcus pumilus]
MNEAGRVCPLRYRYGAEALASAPEQVADTLYVVGGLYGNSFALDAVEALAAAEPGLVRLVFNGDFNWFNVDDAGFAAINRRVLAHGAIAGNVEAELGVAGDEAGCGCAYPASVDADTVARSNRIHARLKAVAARHPDVVAALERLPMFARWRVGGLAVGVVHGDADSLAGWRFDPAELDDPANRGWVETTFARAKVSVFAGSHTCAAGLREFDGGVVINNGAAGMGNAPGDGRGRITRISTRPSPHAVSEGLQREGVHIDAVPLCFEASAWQRAFLANWPAGSDAHVSYWARVAGA